MATPDLGNLVAFAGCDAVVLHLLLFPRVMVWVAAPCSAARRRGWISTLRLGLASAVGKEHTVQQMSLAPLVSMAGRGFYGRALAVNWVGLQSWATRASEVFHSSAAH